MILRRIGQELEVAWADMVAKEGRVVNRVVGAANQAPPQPSTAPHSTSSARDKVPAGTPYSPSRLPGFTARKALWSAVALLAVATLVSILGGLMIWLLGGAHGLDIASPRPRGPARQPPSTWVPRAGAPGE